jgi:putative ABC transport system ATP-binding protein
MPCPERMLLELKDVSRAYQAADGGFTLQVPELTIAPGETVVVVGPSGSGKSTLLDLLAFIAKPDRITRFGFRPTPGEVHDIGALWRRAPGRLSRLRGEHIGYVLQTGGLLPFLTVRENLLLPCRRLGRSPRLSPLGRALGLDGLLRRRQHELSVGQRQRVAVARALAHGPALVLADEPTAALDAGLAEMVADALAAAARAIGSALIVVTHDSTIAARVGGRIIACRPDPAARSATVAA